VADGELAMTICTAAREALSLRDQALAALDGGDPSVALGIVRQGLACLGAAGLRGGADEAALLVALAEIEEALGRFSDARATIAAAIAILEDAVAEDGDDDSLMLWCQAHERLAGLERLAGTSPGPRPGYARCWTGRRRCWGRRRWLWCRPPTP
jgi:hypothetical protein